MMEKKIYLLLVLFACTAKTFGWLADDYRRDLLADEYRRDLLAEDYIAYKEWLADRYLQDWLAEDHKEDWPAKEEKTKCSTHTKQKAIYIQYEFEPTLKDKQATKVEVEIRWDELKYAPWMTKKAGGVYASNLFGVEGGLSGYFGTIIYGKGGGKFLFSMWDKRKSVKSKAKVLAWPMSANCKRNCNDCGRHKYGGVTTGTQCQSLLPDMALGDHFRLRLEQTNKSKTINTKDHGGFSAGDKKIGEHDRDITGAVWTVTVVNKKTNKKHEIGEMLFQGDGEGVDRLKAFDEMVGCRRCNDMFHKDTRFGPFIDDGDKDERKPLSVSARTKATGSTCQLFGVTGSKKEVMIQFEAGPGAEGNFKAGNVEKIW